MNFSVTKTKTEQLSSGGVVGLGCMEMPLEDVDTLRRYRSVGKLADLLAGKLVMVNGKKYRLNDFYSGFQLTVFNENKKRWVGTGLMLSTFVYLCESGL